MTLQVAIRRFRFERLVEVEPETRQSNNESRHQPSVYLCNNIQCTNIHVLLDVKAATFAHGHLHGDAWILAGRNKT